MESELWSYKINKYLGGGGFGDVYYVTKTCGFEQGAPFAMKKIRCNSEINENQKKEILKEAEILKKIDSEYIVSYYESFIYKGIPYLIMNYYNNGDLYEFIFKKKFNGGDKRKKIFTIFTKILLGLFELHKQHIVHRDIKPSNIMMADDLSPKIGDLGLSKILGSTNSTMNTLAGTLMYQAPEMINANPSYTLKTDIWALGITLYMMFLGKKPYPEDNPGQLLFLIMQGKYYPIPKDSDPDLKKLTEKILCVNPSNRPSAENILDDSILVKNLKIYGLLDLVTKTKNKVSKILNDQIKEKNQNFPKYYLRNGLRCVDWMTWVKDLRCPYCCKIPDMANHFIHDIKNMGGGDPDKVDWNECDLLDFTYWAYNCDKCNNRFIVHNDYISNHY